MIGRRECRRRARALGVQERSVEQDFILSCLLAACADDPGPCIFRGGTALARTYWVDFRLSEDLDLIADCPSTELAEWMAGLVNRAASYAAAPLALRFGPPNQGWPRSFVEWSDRRLVVDANLNERPCLPTELRALDLPYEDLRGSDRSVQTISLAEILGNKWYMIEERSEPRDLFDVWWGVARVGVPFATLAEGHRGRYRYQPVRQVLSRAEKRLKAAWEDRLAHQLRESPDFDVVLAEVGEAYDRWEQAGKP